MKQKVITNVFDSWEETIIWSCLQGVMGDVYTNDAEDAAMAILGDFAFYAGNPSEELIQFKPEKCKQDFIIMIPHNEEWGRLIEKIKFNNWLSFSPMMKGCVYSVCILGHMMMSRPQ